MWRMIVGAVVFLVAVGLTLGWFTTRSPAGPLPSTNPAAVAGMVLEDASKPGWPRHAVDPADYARVLQLFEGGVPDPTVPFRPVASSAHGASVPGSTPTGWLPVGRVVIDYRSGPPRVATLFRTGSEPGAYSVTGADGTTYYRGSSDDEIAETLSACLQRAADRREE